jgi:hypothetical protein
MSDDSTRTVTVELTLERRMLDALVSIRENQREQLATDSWGRNVAELSNESPDEAVGKLVKRAYWNKLQRELRDPTGLDGPVGADKRCRPD